MECAFFKAIPLQRLQRPGILSSMVIVSMGGVVYMSIWHTCCYCFCYFFHSYLNTHIYGCVILYS